MTDSKRVLVPEFELSGPPCQKLGCDGVLINCLSLNTKEFYKKCSECQTEFNRCPAREKLDWAKGIIEKMLKGVDDE
jgi:hypothetical protein